MWTPFRPDPSDKIGRLERFGSAVIRPLLHRAGLDIVRYKESTSLYPRDFEGWSIEICEAVRPYTMTSKERVNALVNAVRYVVDADIRGAFVECGVWKGGSAMAMALTLLKLGAEARDLYLFDTYSGMTPPTKVDLSTYGESAETYFSKTKLSDGTSDWCLASLEEVKANLLCTDYPTRNLHFIDGRVEETLPGSAPEEIAVLRLDTDWYESTMHELIHLFPRLQANGVLIVDDYGYWKGVRKAVDEYFAAHNISILLNRIDESARIGIKSPVD